MKRKLETIKIENCNKAQMYRNLHKDPITTIILTAKTIIAEYKDDNGHSPAKPKHSQPSSSQAKA